MADIEAAVHAQEIVDRDGVARILRVRPRRRSARDRRGESLPCRTRMPIRALVTDLVADQPMTWRVDAIARGIALGDDLAVAHHHHGLGVAIRRRRRSRRRRDRAPASASGSAGFDGRRAGDLGQQARARACAAARCRPAPAARRAAPGSPAGRDRRRGPRRAPAKLARHLGAGAIDLVAGQEADRRQHRGDRLAIELLGLDPRDEGGGAELMADIAGRHVGRAIEAAAARSRTGAAASRANEIAWRMNGSP